MARSVLKTHQGFTLVQLMVSISIIAVLASIIAVTMPRIIDAADGAACIGKMRNLSTALGTYLSDNRQWPQMPREYYEEPEKAAEFWYESLKDYGMSQESDWLCPSWERSMQKDGVENADLPLHLRVSYHPATFDDNPTTPTKSKEIPWAIEVGGQHPDGSNVLLSDGRVIPMAKHMTNKY